MKKIFLLTVFFLLNVLAFDFKGISTLKNLYQFEAIKYQLETKQNLFLTKELPEIEVFAFFLNKNSFYSKKYVNLQIFFLKLNSLLIKNIILNNKLSFIKEQQ